MLDYGAQLGAIPNRVAALQARWAVRQTLMHRVRSIRHGEFRSIAPDLFDTDWPAPIVANTIDEAAKSYAANLGVMPTITCSPTTMLSESQQRSADKRTRIANSYVESSNLQVGLIRAADQLGTYGLATMLVYPDMDAKGPRIRVEDSIGIYPVWNANGETVEVAHSYLRDWFSLSSDYPQVEQIRDKFSKSMVTSEMVEVVRHIDAKRVVVYLPRFGNFILEDFNNPVSTCWYECIKSPWLDEDPKGNYDDIVFVQLARHALQMSLMSGIDQAVNAPLIVPMDVADVPLGPQAVIRTQAGSSAVGRARLDMPPQAFSAVEQLRAEMHGAANPEPLSGSVDASVITGQGIKQLMGGYSSQIQASQTALAAGLQRVIGKAFMIDQRLFGSIEKTAQGMVSGESYELQYRPSKDIADNFTCDVVYGFAAGQDPNRAVVMLLQAQAAGLMSKEYAMRNLPVSINVTEERQRIEIEAQRDALRMALSAYAQSIPQLAANGQDASQPVLVVAQVAARLKKGEPLEDIVTEVFAPPKPEPQEQAQPVMPGEPGSVGTADASGFNAAGLPGSMKVGLATEGANGRPDLQQMFAGMSSNGRPQLSAGVSRMAPATGA